MPRIESRVPSTGRSNGWFSNTAWVNCSKATSEGSSSFMLISSITTDRSASMSLGRKAGRWSISASTSSPVGRSWSSSRAQKQVKSLDVKALDSAPIESNVSAMARADIVSEPLKSRCSRKWEAPASFGRSSRVPVSTQHPAATERREGISSVMTRRPLGRTEKS